MSEEGDIQIQEETSRSLECMYFLFSSVIKQQKSVFRALQSFSDVKKILHKDFLSFFFFFLFQISLISISVLHRQCQSAFRLEAHCTRNLMDQSSWLYSVHSKATSSVQTTEGHLWEVTMRACSSSLLWDGRFHSLAWQPNDICHSDSYLVLLPRNRHYNQPPLPCLAQPCCSSFDKCALGAGVIHIPWKSHVAHELWASH